MAISTNKPSKGDRVCFKIKKEYWLGKVTRSGIKIHVLFDNGDKESFTPTSVNYIGKVGKRKKKVVKLDELHKFLSETKVSFARLNKYPETYSKKLDTKTLISVIKQARDKYYKTSKPLFNDDTYDLIEDELRRRKPNHKLLQEVDAPTKKKGMVDLPFYMPSLNKVKTEKALNAFLKKYDGPFCLSDKMDGISLGLKSDKKYTRGHAGKQGQDVSHMPVKLPKLPGTMEVRAELEMSESKFAKVFPDASNARNTVSGLLNLNSIDPKIAKSVDVVAYEVVKPSLKPSDQFKKLKTLGFKIPAFKVVKKLDINSLTAYYLDRKKKSKYAIDGIVVTQNEKMSRTKSGNPDHSVAFKVNAISDSRVVKVIKVHWKAGKDGYINPRIEIEETVLSKVKVNYCNGFNAKYIMDNKIGPGAKIRVIRSGEVIPHILEVVKKAKKAQMPDMDYIWIESGVHIVLVGESEVVDVKKIATFFKVIGVKDVALKAFEKMYNEGYTTIPQILKLKKKDLLAIDGFQEKTANKILANILEASQEIEIHTLAFASGCFGRTLGSRRHKQIFETFPDIMKKKASPAMVKLLSKLPGFKDKISTAFVTDLPKFKSFVRSIPKRVKVVLPKKIKKRSSLLEGKRIVFTGVRDKELETAIQANGGSLGSSVNKNTILIVKTMDSSSSKMSKAIELGIPVMTVTQFQSKYKIG